ncbi:MAG: hypothetical protein IJ624_04110 [Prevotella sp.]|nr:hypothetical protein [Prevotella sp.]
MKKLFFSILYGIAAPLGGCLLRIVPLGILFAYLLCNIEAEHTYGWFSGLWHGIFIPFNLLRGLFVNALCKAESCTTMYNVFWWVLAASWAYTFLGLFFASIKDTITCYKHGPESLNLD